MKTIFAEKGSVSEYRFRIGAEILREMKKKNDLPLPNVHRLAKVMYEYFRTMGYREKVKEDGYKWIGDTKYWKNNIQGVCNYLLVEDKKPFGYYCKQGTIKNGLWKFLTEAEYKEIAERDFNGLDTRRITYNAKVNNGNEVGYHMQLPIILDFPQIGESPKKQKRIG